MSSEGSAVELAESDEIVGVLEVVNAFGRVDAVRLELVAEGIHVVVLEKSLCNRVLKVGYLVGGE